MTYSARSRGTGPRHGFQPVTCRSVVTAVLLLGLISSVTVADPIEGISFSDKLAFHRAQTMIETIRKGEVVLRVVDEHDQPIPGLTVQYHQTGHAFQFGIFLSKFDPTVFTTMRAAGVNAVTLHMNWWTTQPKPEGDNFAAVTSRWGLPQLAASGVNIKAHSVFWFSPEVMPPYLKEASREELLRLSRLRIPTMVEQFRDAVDTWELVNEPLAPWANKPELTSEELLSILKAYAEQVRTADPTATTLINFADPIGRSYKTVTPKPIDFPVACKAAGVHHDVIGLQDYYNAFNNENLFPSLSLAKQVSMINRFARHGKPIHMTEITVPSSIRDHLPESSRGYWNRQWSPALQADYLTVAYTLFFGHPAVHSITWWDDTDGGFIHNGGLLDRHYRPKPSYHALQSLIAQWTSTGIAQTQPNGHARIRGFAGTYEATVRDPATGQTMTTSFTIKERTETTHTVVLNRAALEQKERTDLARLRQRLQQAEHLAAYWKKTDHAARTRYAQPTLAAARAALASTDWRAAEPFLNDALNRLSIPQATTLLAQQMRNTLKEQYKLNAATNGALYTNGELIYSKRFEGGIVRIEIDARGDQAGDAPPRASVLIGDRAYGAFDVPSTDWQRYSLELTVPKGQHDLVIRYLNDIKTDAGGDRNLFIKQVRIVEYHHRVPEEVADQGADAPE